MTIMFDDVAQRPLRIRDTSYSNEFSLLDAKGAFVGRIMLSVNYETAITRAMAETMVAWINQGIIEPPAKEEPLPYVVSTSQDADGRWFFNLHSAGTVRKSTIWFDTQADARAAADQLRTETWLAATTLVHDPDNGMFQGHKG